jgi:hypothetical protein
MNGEHYLAICSVASGLQAPYNNHTTQFLYRWDGKSFKVMQTFKGYASKSWTHFEMQGKHYLALANGVQLPGHPKQDTRSYVFAWSGTKFEELQSFDSTWAYKFTQFNIGKRSFLALTDHLKSSKLYEWDGRKFISFQNFDDKGGRVFHHFKIGTTDYLALANIFSDSTIYRWNGKGFELNQTLKGLGGRNFLHFKSGDKDYLLKVVFITGTRQNPQSQQESPIYLFEKGQFKEVSSIKTSGAVRASLFESNGNEYIALANSLSKEIRFAEQSVIYRIQETV